MPRDAHKQSRTQVGEGVCAACSCVMPRAFLCRLREHLLQEEFVSDPPPPPFTHVLLLVLLELEQQQK
jgi:hypothetical protein